METTIKISRIRHFFEFESPFTSKRVEEITFFNNRETVKSLLHISPDFKNYLEIYDNSGMKLEFHSYIEDYFSVENENQKNEILNPRNQNPITRESKNCQFIIDFPSERPFNNSEFRTIALHDRIDGILKRPVYPVKLNVPMDYASHTYIFIKKVQHFQMVINIRLSSKSSPNTYFLLEQSEEREYMKEFENNTYYCIFSIVPIENCNMNIFIKYKLKPKDFLWFYGGIGLGIATFIVNIPLLFFKPLTYLTQISVLSTITISYLVITKGWIFFNSLDEIAEVFPEQVPVSIQFNIVYLILIILLFIEISLGLVMILL